MERKPPKLISSQWNAFDNRFIPVIWFGIIAIFLANAASLRNQKIFLIALVASIGMAVLALILMKKLGSDHVDEVYDEGDALLLLSRGQELRVRLTEIVGVRSSTVTKPLRITLTFHNNDGSLSNVSFTPRRSGRILLLSRHPLAEELIARVDAARTPLR